MVITDGRDNSSVTSLADLAKAAQQSGVIIYSVGLLALDDARSEITRAKSSLRDLATATGGESYFPGDLAGVDRIAYRVARDIRNQYTIGYTPSNQEMDSSYRKIRIAVNARRGLTARTRSGYFATSDQSSPGR